MRLLRPSLAVFCLALLASLCIHLPVYEALGALAGVLLRAPAKEQHGVVELELAPLTEESTPPAAEPKPEPKPAEVAKPEVKPEVKQPEPKQPEAEAKKDPQPSPVKPELVQPTPTVEPRPLPTPTDRPLAITQKSDNPDVEKPDNAKFIADENRRVQEETVARMRNMQRDDQQPSSAGPTKPDQDEGNANKTDVADLHDVKGMNDRPATEREAEHTPEHPSNPSAGLRQALAMAARPSGQAQAAPSPEVAPSRASGAPLQGGEPETIVIHDGAGTFRIRKSPPGQGPGEAGGAMQPGKATSERNTRTGQRAQNAVNLRVSWSQFEDTFGADELRQQREAYVAQRRSTAAGGGRQKSWKQFRAAIENFVPNVRPGDQTALNAAADPFANFLSMVHRRIHRKFAEDFLSNLPLAGGPYGDYSLHTELEIVFNGDGSVHQIGIIETSGFLPFDHAAFDAVMGAAPYPTPPRTILSGDGRVYVHWGFYRNERQCGTFNARPFILPHPPGTPQPGKGPLNDPGEHPSGPAVPAQGEGGLGMRAPVPLGARPYDAIG
ncbi:MAG: hypothetical protein ACHQ53_15420 [Polyangiales bacterium]